MGGVGLLVNFRVTVSPNPHPKSGILGSSSDAKILSAGDRAASVRLDALVTSSTLSKSLNTIRSNSLQRPANNQKGISERMFGSLKKDAGKKAPNVQEEVDAVEPLTNPAGTFEPWIVLPKFSGRKMPGVPNRSVDNTVSIVNGLALGDVSKSSPKSAVPTKRKRKEADDADGSPKKRVASRSGTAGTRDEPSATSTNGVTGHGGRSNRASPKVASVAPGMLPRPKKEQQKTGFYSVSQNNGDIWDPAPSPQKQAKKPASRPTQNQEPKGQRKSSRIQSQKDHTEPAVLTRSTRSTIAANGHTDVIPTWNDAIDLSKKPERDARKAAKQRKSLHHRPRNQDVSAGYEEEELLEGEKRRVPEEVIDSSGQTSIPMDQGDEGAEAEAGEENSDSDDSDEVIGNNEEDDEEEDEDKGLKVFGQDRAWKTILEGAKSVCGAKLPLNHMPKLLTMTIKVLIHEVREARSFYEQLLSGTDHDSLHGLNDQLKKSLNAVEDRIRSLSEKAAGNKCSEMIRDIYARAIPAVVFLLKSALRSRKYHSDEPCDLETLNETVKGLREIIRVQAMAVLLCEKATRWKAKPVPTRLPIVRPTTRKMFPCLRDTRKAFSKILLEQDRKRKMKQNSVDSAKRQKELLQSAQQAKLEAARKNAILYKRIGESMKQEDERRRNEKRTLKQFKEDEFLAGRQSRQVSGHADLKTLWSTAEDIALYYQLEKGYAGGLTSTFEIRHQLSHRCSLTTLAAEERYSNILNTPLLQNKLPQHIRERALYFKPTLLEERGALEWISSIE